MTAFENKIFFKGIKDAASSSSVDSKTQEISQAEVMERHNSQNNAQEYHTASPMHNIEHISPEHLNAINEALGDELENRVNLDKLQRESDEETIAELTEEVAWANFRTDEMRDNARGWEEKYKKEYECSAMWRDRFLDMERQKNKLEQAVSVEVSNRKYAEKLMDDALIAKYQDEQLSVMLAAKFVDVSKRNSEGN